MYCTLLYRANFITSWVFSHGWGLEVAESWLIRCNLPCLRDWLNSWSLGGFGDRCQQWDWEGVGCGAPQGGGQVVWKSTPKTFNWVERPTQGGDCCSQRRSFGSTQGGANSCWRWKPSQGMHLYQDYPGQNNWSRLSPSTCLLWIV